ncbi:MAG TPA: OmpA family protein, partial [Cytophagales bacterium]|nr:OmpA family protein [Cytophagales bacterium]
LKQSHLRKLKELESIDTSITASNFKSYFKRSMNKADSTLLKKAKLKKDLLKVDTSSFTNVETATVKQPLPKTKVGIIKKSIYSELATTGDTSMASLIEHIKWIDTTDHTGSFEIDLKKGKDHVFVFNNDKKKTLIKKISAASDTNLAINMENISVKQADTTKSKISNALSTNIDKIKQGSGGESLFVLDNLYFDFDSDEIKEESKGILQLVLDFLNKNQNVNMEILGHTDNRGSEEHNLDLSQRRAESVMTWLIANGIIEKRLSATGFGEAKPVLPNQNPDGSDNPENRAKNRRTEVKIIYVK